MGRGERPSEPQYPEVKITDTHGAEIKVGTRVMYFDSTVPGIVTAISDIDGDVDDDTGRSVMVPPQITVKMRMVTKRNTGRATSSGSSMTGC